MPDASFFGHVGSKGVTDEAIVCGWVIGAAAAAVVAVPLAFVR
jgi:hypothetical protein